MNNFWNVLAEKYLDNVFYRRKIDAAANNGGAFASSVISTAAAMAGDNT